MAPTPRVDNLNSLTNPFLRNFYNLGAWSERNFGTFMSRSADGIGQTSAAAGKYYSTPQMKIDSWDPYNFGQAEAFSEPGVMARAPIWSRGLSVLGNSLDAATGVLSLAQTYKQDVDMGSIYGSSNLIKSATGSVVQIGAGAYAGGLAAAGLAALGAPAIVGIGLGVGAALGTGYLAGQIFDWGWSQIF